jgi:hypothetical protein
MPTYDREMRSALAATALAALTLAAIAAGGPPGKWTPVSKGTVESSDEAGLARTADGVLHLVWQRHGAVTSALWQTRISAEGVSLGLGPVAPGLSEPGSPALTTAPDGSLRAFFFARTADEKRAELMLATASPSGEWTVGAESFADVKGNAAPAVAAAATRDGTPVVAWSSGNQIRYRLGVEPATPSATLGVGGCCASGVQPAVDQVTGRAYIAWASSAPRGMGVYVQAVDRGGPTRPKVFATGSATKKRNFAVLPEGRVALSSRIGGPGVYLAYTSGYPKVRTVSVLQAGARKLVLEIKAPEAAHVTLAAASQGRLWLAWSHGGQIFATRTNRAVTRIGAVRKVAFRRGALALDHLQGDATLGPLDLVASFEARGNPTFWHQRVLPGLSLAITAIPSSGGPTRYVFRVTDAGEPVANAAVRVGKQTLTTGLSGAVALETSDHPPSASASKLGYAPATTPIP